jgi:dTDP-4-amino-4,6-dideoxygalactose transaminase
MPDIVAAIGCAQLSKIDDLIESRRAVAAHYRDGIADISGVEPHTSLENDSHVFQLFTIVLKDQKNRQQIIEKLTNEKISCKIYWDPPLHRGNVFTADAHLSLPITESVSNRVLSLPMYPTLSFESVDRVVDLLRDAAEGFHNEAASNDTKNEHIE